MATFWELTQQMTRLKRQEETLVDQEEVDQEEVEIFLNNYQNNITERNEKIKRIRDYLLYLQHSIEMGNDEIKRIESLVKKKEDKSRQFKTGIAKIFRTKRYCGNRGGYFSH